MTKPLVINQEHFGKDKQRRYLRHDFMRVLLDIVQREVMSYVFLECSKAYQNKIEEKNEKGEVIKVSHGIFDPDNSHFLYSILNTHDKGLIVDLRQLLVGKESGAGGKFVKDIIKLNIEDFFDYYKNGNPGKIMIPKVLLKHVVKKSEGDKIDANELLTSHRNEIENVYNELILRAKKFNDAGYHDAIVKDYQGLELHKDKMPEKYDISESPDEKFGFLTIKRITRKSKSKIETVLISEAMEDFSAIIFLYQSLIGDNTSFIASNFPLDTHIQRTFELFDKKVPLERRSKVKDDIVKNLPFSLNLVGWRVESS